MTSVLIGLGVNVLTQITKKLKLSGTVMAIVLSIVGGGLYWYFMNYQPELWTELVKKSAEIYATSQIVYNLIKKFNLLKLDNE